MSTKVIFLFFFFELHSSKECELFEIDRNYLNKRLIGHGIYEMIVNRRHDCIRECFYLKKCKSVDYNEQNHTCKLNDVDGKSVAMTDFEDRKGSIFSDISDWPKVISSYTHGSFRRTSIAAPNLLL